MPPLLFFRSGVMILYRRSLAMTDPNRHGRASTRPFTSLKLLFGNSHFDFGAKDYRHARPRVPWFVHIVA